MKLTGQKLREKRESARLTISEVSLATKINPKVLTAMEIGDTSHLPAKTFLRGFVRAYAGFLKMNVAELLELFNQEQGEAAAAAAAASLVLPETPEGSDNSSDPKAKRETSQRVDMSGEGSGTFRMVVIGGILILIVLIIGVRSVVQKYEREGNVDASADLSASKVIPLDEKKTKVDTDVTSPPGAAESNPASITTSGGTVAPPSVAGADDEEAMEKKAIEDKKAAEDKVFADAKVATEKKVAKEKIVAHDKVAVEAAAVEKSTEEVKVVADKKVASDAKKANEDKKPSDEKKPTLSTSKRHEIILEALDKVEVTFKLKGQSKKIPMTTGQVHTIVTDEPISFDISDGGALNITDNGRDKGPAGDLGHRMQVSVP